ncbi:MAG TPA: glycosyltransferase family 87 protein [Candidatus Solibacter sp.]|nr:glycosyltransferase family 87 protein [Candidatus Solibacter sp.]
MAVALADRLAFYTTTGMVLLLLATLALGLAAVAPDPPGAEPVIYSPLLLALAVLAAVTAEVPVRRDAAVVILTISGGLAFYVCTLVPGLRRFRLWVVAALLIAAEAVIIIRVPSPAHQDVWRFLDYGIDGMFKGQNPYSGTTVGADGGIFRLTYPPAALLLLAPFRLVLGDIRWGYLASQAIVVALLPRLIRRRTGTLARWQEALILMPLALPRVSQAFFTFSNHEWVLLALAAAALLLALDSRAVWAGVVTGLGIAAKQYFIVFPVLYLLPELRRRTLLVALGVAVAVTVPFVAWGPSMFIEHVFGNLTSAPNTDRLTLWAMLHNSGLPSGPAVSLGLAIAGAAVVVLLAWRARRDLSRSLMACGLGLVAFTLGATFAGYNYYVYALVFFTWGLMIPTAPSRLVKSD